MTPLNVGAAFAAILPATVVAVLGIACSAIAAPLPPAPTPPVNTSEPTWPSACPNWSDKLFLNSGSCGATSSIALLNQLPNLINASLTGPSFTLPPVIADVPISTSVPNPFTGLPIRFL